MKPGDFVHIKANGLGAMTVSPGDADQRDNPMFRVMRPDDLGLVIATCIVSGNNGPRDEVLVLACDRLGWALSDDMRVLE